MSVIPFETMQKRNPLWAWQGLKRQINKLESELEDFNLVTDCVDQHRIGVAQLQNRQNYHEASVRFADVTTSLGTFSPNNSESYQHLLSSLYRFLNEQGPEPLALYRLPIFGLEVSDPVVIEKNKWMSPDVYRHNR